MNVVARASRFALAYSTNEVGNSGWRWFDAGPEWALFTLEYDVPVMKTGNGDFIGILPGTEGRPRIEVSCLTVSLTGGLDFPGELFDADWYADAYPELELTRELPRETRFIGSIQHYLRVGRRQPRMRRRASRYRVLRATASWPTSSAGR